MAFMGILVGLRVSGGGLAFCFVQTKIRVVLNAGLATVLCKPFSPEVDGVYALVVSEVLHERIEKQVCFALQRASNAVMRAYRPLLDKLDPPIPSTW